MGNNGTGKSTFIKMLMGEVEPDSGGFDVGETVRFGYYSQDGLQFDEQMKVIGWYHEKRDDERGIGLGPEHDWSSHGADAFGLIAVARPLLIPRVHENDDDFEGWQADDGRSSIAGY